MFKYPQVALLDQFLVLAFDVANQDVEIDTHGVADLANEVLLLAASLQLVVAV